MGKTTILVPVRYPLRESNVRTIKKAIEIADQQDDANLYICHINVIHKNEHVQKSDLVHAVENEFGCLPNATYEISKAFLIEEAILNEIVQQKAGYVVIGKDRRARWRRILSRLIGTDINLERFLREHSTANLIVV